MADVTLSFVANDDGVMKSLNRQEAAIQASLSRLNNQYTGITRKFIGAGAVGGFLGGLGVGSAFGVAHKLLDSYSQSSERAAVQTAKLSKEWDRAWRNASDIWLGAGAEILTNIAEGPGGPIIASMGGLLGAGEVGGIARMQRENERLVASLEKSIPTMNRYKDQVGGMYAAFEKEIEASLIYETRNSPRAEQQRRMASLRARQRDDEITTSLTAGQVLPEAAASMRRENDLRYVTELSDIAKVEKDGADAYAMAVDKQTDLIIDLAKARDDAEKRVGENIDLELAAFEVGTLKNRGDEAAARYAQIELDLRSKLLEVSRLENASEADKLRLREAAAGLAESQIAEFERSSREIFGGRGVESGIASALGVVRGSLVASARDNPAALQKRSNELLERIARAVEDGSSATFAP